MPNEEWYEREITRYEELRHRWYQKWVRNEVDTAYYRQKRDAMNQHIKKLKEMLKYVKPQPI